MRCLIFWQLPLAPGFDGVKPGANGAILQKLRRKWIVSPLYRSGLPPGSFMQEREDVWRAAKYSGCP
jgi:hypothetical protein